MKPMIGFRAKLLTRGEGKWALSTGDNAKFGLNTAEILFAIEKLRSRQADPVPPARPLPHRLAGAEHHHDQERRHRGRPASTASSPRWASPWATSTSAAASASTTTARAPTSSRSMNYSLEEYARDVVFNIREICTRTQACPSPTSSPSRGRAVVAPPLHARRRGLRAHQQARVARPAAPAEGQAQGRHRPGGPAEEQGPARPPRALPRRAPEEGGGASRCSTSATSTSRTAPPPRRSSGRSASRSTRRAARPATSPRSCTTSTKHLADQYVCNFSVFQSLLDHWALEQLFPIAPLHRLNERPDGQRASWSTSPATPTARSAASSTCRTCKDYVTLHPLNNKPYYLGIFLTGAYQDIMGDLHNLFGRVNEVHVFLEDDEPNGFYIEEALSRQPHRRRDRGRAVPAGGALPPDEGSRSTPPPARTWSSRARACACSSSTRARCWPRPT